MDNCLLIKNWERMKAMRTAYTESRGATVTRNEWEGILERFDVLADEINRALHLTTRIEEPRSGVRIARIG